VKNATGIATNKINKTITYKLKFKLRTRKSGIGIPSEPKMRQANEGYANLL